MQSLKAKVQAHAAQAKQLFLQPSSRQHSQVRKLRESQSQRVGFTPLGAGRGRNFAQPSPSSGDLHRLTRALEESEVALDDGSTPSRV